MDFVRAMLSRIASLIRREKLDADLDEEFKSHIAFATEEYLARGMSQAEAKRMALREFGGVAQVKERYRVQRGVPFLDVFLQDMRYAFRQLSKSRGFAFTAIVTLALAVGAVTAVFSVVDAVLLNPYAFRDPGRLVVWRESIRELQKIAPLLPDNYRHYVNLKTHAKSIEDAAIVQTAGFSVSTVMPGGTSDGTEHPQMTEGLTVSPNFFSVLGVEPFLGRAFTADEAQKGKDKELILTWAAWQRLFHGNPAVLGMNLRVGSDLGTVVGVMPRSFRFPVMSVMPGQATHGSTDRYELFKPLVPMDDELTANDSEFNYVVIARLKPKESVLEAQTELDGIEKATAAADHLALHFSVIVEPFAREITGDYRKPLWLLFAAVSGVLLMACVNLANLQIARGVKRDHEIALRSALGAGRGRLLRGVLAENVLIGVFGGLAGIAFAFVAVRLLLVTASTLPRLNEVRLSLPMLTVALVLSIATSLAFGILPALRAVRVMPQRVLQSGSSRMSGNRHAVGLRKLLVAVEVGLSVALLIVTALITRSFSNVMTQDRQFNAQHVVAARADLSASRYSADLDDDGNAEGGKVPPREAMISKSLGLLRSLPGVEFASVSSVLPMTGEESVELLKRPDHPVPAGQEPMANLRVISPGYLSTMGIDLLSGRDFSEADRGKMRVVILSRKAAQDAFPDGNAIGRTIDFWDHVRTVVGITADARTNDLKHDSAFLYLPYWDGPPAHPVFLARSSQPIQSLGPTMRQMLWRVDPDISIPTVVTLEEQVQESVATEKFQAVLLSSFGSAALLLAVLGIYGILAYSVLVRVQEFGIRIALGSGKVGLARLALGEIVYPVVGGVIAGLFVALSIAKWMRSLLYETSVIDPWSLSASIAVLLVAVLLAALVPLRRATSVNPVDALRAD